MGLALKVMPVAETVAIIYLAPIAVMLVAWRFMGEVVNWAGWLGAVVGFAGVVLIVRPGTGLDPWGVALCVTNAALSTAYHLLTRILSRTETTPALLAHTALVGAVVFSALLVVQPATTLPTPLDFALIIALGTLATAGHFLFTAAYAKAPASLPCPGQLPAPRLGRVAGLGGVRPRARRGDGAGHGDGGAGGRRGGAAQPVRTEHRRSGRKTLMQTRHLGQGFEVSALGRGCMGMSQS